MIPPVPYHLVNVFAWSCQPSLRPCSTLRMVLNYSQRSAAVSVTARSIPRKPMQPTVQRKRSPLSPWLV